MKVSYFPDTDTLLITFSDREIAEARDLNEDILIELDQDSALASMTIEHAKEQTDAHELSYQQVAGQVLL